MNKATRHSKRANNPFNRRWKITHNTPPNRKARQNAAHFLAFCIRFEEAQAFEVPDPDLPCFLRRQAE